VAIAHAVKRRNHVVGKAASLFQNSVDQVIAPIAVHILALALGCLGWEFLRRAGRVLERECDIGDRCAIGHGGNLSRRRHASTRSGGKSHDDMWQPCESRRTARRSGD
jgi:hypothetical protein